MIAALLSMGAHADLTPQQYANKVNGVCSSRAMISRVANQQVIYEMCVKGAKDSHAVCEKNIKSFNREADKLKGMDRAEYVEISEAYRTGCMQ